MSPSSKAASMSASVTPSPMRWPSPHFEGEYSCAWTAPNQATMSATCCPPARVRYWFWSRSLATVPVTPASVDGDVALEARHLLLVDVLAYLPAELLHPLVGPVLFELAQH